ncbi:MAG: hypothetical protein IID35_07325 [Planctomycetes bacterium]|nr:hypothetical protein [Planctomycetota bacterium]
MICGCFVATEAAAKPSGPSAPAISETHRAFLSRMARRTVRDVALGRERYKPQYVPRSIENVTGEVIVRLWEEGYLRATGVGQSGPVAKATRDAAYSAALIARESLQAQAGRANEVLIEIEVIGPGEMMPVVGDWTRPGALDAFIEFGVHGVVLLGPKKRRRICASEMIGADMPLSDVLTGLAQGSQLDSSQLGKYRLLRFRTARWYEERSSAAVVSLQRGMTLVPPEAVRPRLVDAAISRIAEYMVYRQLPTGLFTYEFSPGLDRFSESNSLVRQVGAAIAVSAHAKYTGKSASRAASDLAVAYHLKGLTPISSAENAAFIATADDQNKLGVTALLCIALSEHPDARSYVDVRERLVNAMLWLQRPSGLFVTAFPPAVEIKGQEYFPGEALFALAREYARDPSAKILDAFDRSISFYRDYFRAGRTPAFVPWQIQAFALMAHQTKRRDFVDYVFELTDWLAAKQLTPSNCDWPEMYGGVAAHRTGRAGASTASYLEGFTDALGVARAFGDSERVRRYETVVRLATRFVMQLEVRREEARFMRSPQDAVGGIRTSPALSRLRIDHCQHALIALIKARKILFGDKE